MAAILGSSPFAGLAWSTAPSAQFAPFPQYELATFSADVTPPLGHPLLAGFSPPAKEIEDPLFARGFVLKGGDKPFVLVSVDWCEIRNDSHDRWRSVLAEAAGTSPDRVLVTSVHQHDAPLGDVEAQRILDKHRLPTRLCDPEFHEHAVQTVARAVRDALKTSSRITHVGMGQAEVRGIASNRRYLNPEGKPQFDRGSTTTNQYARDQPEGTIDPWLKTLSFWDGERPIAALNAYATHPMSYYRTGKVSADFPGLARRRRQADNPNVFQIYVSGCSGNVTAGKYNDGSPANRPLLADRLYQGMVAAWEATRRHPLDQIEFRAARLRLEPLSSPGYTVEEMQQQLAAGADPRAQIRAAMGLAWRKRADSGYQLDVPLIDFGVAQLLLLPGESYVEYQLLAQRQRPDSFVVVAGYGECAPGYIPIERALNEGDGNLRDWCWVAPGAEQAMTKAIEAVLPRK